MNGPQTPAACMIHADNDGVAHASPYMSYAGSLVSRSWRTVRDLLFPRGCAGCDRPDAVLCPQCAALFAQCRRRELIGGATLGGAPDTRGVPVWSAAVYQGTVRHAILEWKDHDDVELDAVFAGIMDMLTVRAAVAGRCPADRPLLVVPAPSSLQSMRRRGRRHTLPLARAVARSLRAQGIRAEVSPLLTSNASGGRSVQQTSSAQRAKRIGGRIVIREKALQREAPVVLVDDIITTGATLRQCVKALELGGANVVGALTLASAVMRDFDLR